LANSFIRVYCLDNGLPVCRVKPLSSEQYYFNQACLQMDYITDFMLISAAELLIEHYEQQKELL
jgi:hypothetical protein